MIKTKHVWQEIIKPEDFDKIEDMKELYNALYKALYMNTRILLDIRHATLNSSSPEKPKRKQVLSFESVPLSQPVIKDSDNIKGKDNDEK